MVRSSLAFWVALALQFHYFLGGVFCPVLLLITSCLLSRLLRVFVLDKWRYQVPSDGSWWILLTGTSSGFGKLGALHLASCGLNVLATVRKQSDGDALLSQAPSDAVRQRIHVVLMDVGSLESIKQARDNIVSKLEQQNGQLVAVINNAGVSYTGPLEGIPIGKWRKQFSVNFFGAIAVTQAFLPLLKKAAKAGLSPRVIHMGSVVGDVAMVENSPYASKWHKYGIKTVVIQPGLFRTEIFASAAAMLARTPEEGDDLLDDEMTKAYQAFEVKGDIMAQATAFYPSPEPVAKAMETSVLAKVPEAKCFVGYDSALYQFFSLLPDEVLDIVVLGAAHLLDLPFIRNAFIAKTTSTSSHPKAE